MSFSNLNHYLLSYFRGTTLVDLDVTRALTFVCDLSSTTYDGMEKIK